MKESDLIFGLMASLGRKEYSIPDLKHLTAPFSISDSSLRTCLSRMSTKEIIKTRKEGKTAFYSFSRKGGNISSNVSFGFKTSDWSKWNNRWLGIIFSVPAIQKEERYRIRRKLQVYRFASLYPGFWIRPYNLSEKIEQKFDDLLSPGFCKLIDCTFMTKLSNADVETLWNLNQLNDDFQKTLKILKQKKKQLNNFSPQKAFYHKMIVGNTVIQILFKDPLLPGKLLPDKLGR